MSEVALELWPDANTIARPYRISRPLPAFPALLNRTRRASSPPQPSSWPSPRSSRGRRVSRSTSSRTASSRTARRPASMQLSQGADVVVIDAHRDVARAARRAPRRRTGREDCARRLLRRAHPRRGGSSSGTCLDTSLAARMLGRTATGLASLMETELGIAWTRSSSTTTGASVRSNAKHLTYLARDVATSRSSRERLWSRGRASAASPKRSRRRRAIASRRPSPRRAPTIRGRRTCD